MLRNAFMKERLARLEKEFSEQPKRSAEEAYAQYDRQNSVNRTGRKENTDNSPAR